MKMMKKCTELKLQMPWGHIAATAWGSPEKKPVLVVHGTLDNAGSFTRLIQLLPDEYYFIAIDLPGHGLSSHFPPGINLDFFNFILAIKYVLTELNWKTCTYIGHSFGGQLGIMFSVLFPDILEKIISFDAIFPRIVNEKFLVSRIKEVNDATLSEFYNESPVRFYTKDQVLDALQNRRQFSLNEKAAQALFERAVTKVGDKFKYNRDSRMKPMVYPNLNHDQYLEFIKHLKVPAIVILSSNSWFNLSKEFHNNLEFFKTLIPATWIIKVVEGNHDLHNNNPERVSSIVSAYLDSNTKSKL
ncbi:serine hydrolase-like protein [Microplitis demolitor]|uniref:serine hydrolase-like protein n=1 Tax=Microplitis demolitor TaxID=69319 RepID=UPI00043FFFD4|nr:serine hydrolase-like protein [Microplitis demolitor]XP_053593981.1 serine hydrolase-like protein [Microplitis demolitor]